MRLLKYLFIFLLLALPVVAAAIIFAAPEPALTATTIGPDTAVSAQNTDDLIAFWHGRVQQHPHDPISLAYLGQVHWQKGRETGDADSYGRAQAALEQALALNPDDELSLTLMATIQLAQHDFEAALTLAQRVYDFDPGALQALAMMGDAHLELGNYAEAEKAYLELAKRSDNPAVTGRLARLAWLQGEAETSIRLMQDALSQAEALKLEGERLAWFEAQLGELYFHNGRLTEAESQFQKAADTFAGYYLAQAGLGKVAAARGNLDGATAIYEDLIETLPQPEFIARLGDWYLLNNDKSAAQAHYDTVAFIAELQTANNILVNRQLALYFANHNIDLDEAVALAERELETRGDVYAYDTLAWTLFKNGQLTAAAEALELSLAQGTPDALLYYHAGMIYAGQGRTAEAKVMLQNALSINPHFDLLQAQIARETLAQIENTQPVETKP